MPPRVRRAAAVANGCRRPNRSSRYSKRPRVGRPRQPRHIRLFAARLYANAKSVRFKLPGIWRNALALNQSASARACAKGRMRWHSGNARINSGRACRLYAFYYARPRVAPRREVKKYNHGALRRRC